jgi:hypothetical protein
MLIKSIKTNALDKVTGAAIISGLKLDQDAIESVAGQDFDNP